MNAKPDPNENAARIVRESTSTIHPAAHNDIEPAWREWSKHAQKVDDRTTALLRAAFEAGYTAASLLITSTHTTAALKEK